MSKSKEITLSKNKLIIIGVTLMALVVILLLGYIWHSQVQDLQAARAQQEQRIQELKNQVNASEETTDNENQSSDNTSSSDTLKIKEWGINLEFSKAYQVDYSLSEDSTIQAASFTIKDSSVDTSSCINQTKDLGISLVRTNTKTDDMHGTPVKIDSYYYYVSGSPYVCNADVDKDNAPRNIIVSQLNKALTNFLRE